MHPDHTEFWLEEGHWTKAPGIKSKAEKRVNRLLADAIVRDDWLDVRRYPSGQPGSLFDISPIERHRDDG